MKIYVGHSTSYDYIKELYQPLKCLKGWEYNKFILPHDTKIEPTYSKDIISSCDLFIAEVSYHSTGLGIELGWANSSGCDVLCFYKEGAKPSTALNCIYCNFFSYSDSKDLVYKLDSWIAKYSSSNHFQNRICS